MGTTFQGARTRRCGGSSRFFPKRLRGAGSGVLGLPFRLLIALVTIALIVPSVMAGWSSVDYMQTEGRVQEEISRILMAAQRYLQAGSGGEVVDVSFRNGFFTHVEYVVFGDFPGAAYERMVRYKLTGGPEELVGSRNPSVPIMYSEGGPFTVFEGRYSILVECDGGTQITLRAV